MKALYLGKDFKGDPPLYLKIAAGLTTGGLAIAIASPTDLVKVSKTCPDRSYLMIDHVSCLFCSSLIVKGR